jgi:ferredoxin
VCAGLVPEVFEVDDEDNLAILAPEVPSALDAQVRRGVPSCPKKALSLDE